MGQKLLKLLLSDDKIKTNSDTSCSLASRSTDQMEVGRERTSDPVVGSRLMTSTALTLAPEKK